MSRPRSIIFRSCLARFVNGQLPELSRGLHGMHAALSALASFRAEFSYLLTDTNAVGRSLVAWAFTNLQRSIVADEVFGNRWRAAFNAGEIVCEKLGSCHLLLHGVWAFKASAQGERTDLVLDRERTNISMWQCRRVLRAECKSCGGCSMTQPVYNRRGGSLHCSVNLMSSSSGTRRSRGMSRARQITANNLTRALTRVGFAVVRIRGRHHFLRHDDGQQ